ncbi:hypothetical protein COO60DRAFT_1456569 [Scenedesmus sp. NREL 46B-D3]|nr:hypothetical protein COO60DRAFT_1456569 [Scenedesmus sp. NREL 46B-D3]
MDVDAEAASQQMASQREVLDNLRYEAEMLTEKLLKLRSSRQDIEAELFGLKDKRIKLLEVINKLEDEEMQLVSEVNRIIHYKRSLLKEVPLFEARAPQAAQPAPQGVWALPRGSLLLQADAPDSRPSGIAGALSLQQMHGLAGSGNSSAVAGGAAGAGGQLMLVAPLPDGAGQAGAHHASQTKVRLHMGSGFVSLPLVAHSVW